MSCNAAPGPMAPKEGLGWEIGAVEEIHRDTGQFVLLHDLTSCIRIADATEFAPERKRWIEKSRSRGELSQRRPAACRQQSTPSWRANRCPARATPTLSSSPLTTVRTCQHSETPSRWPSSGGLQGFIVRGGKRGVVCSSIPSMFAKAPVEHWLTRWDVERVRIEGKLGLGPGGHALRVLSADAASRSPGVAPYGIYPLTPEQCAELICDFLVFEVRMPAEALADEAEAAGMQVKFLREPINELVDSGAPVFQFLLGSRGVTLHAAAIGELLLEFTTLNTVCAAMKEILESSDPPNWPVPIYANEQSCWR